jgi:uncharacterized membrane protein HdeD (DUF308 family)
MSDEKMISVTEIHLLGLDNVQKRWGWFVVLGLLLVLIGAIALGHSVMTTVISMIFIGWLMVIGGAFQTANAIISRDWGGFFIDLLTGLLYAIAGFLIITRPADSAAAFTLLIAILLMFGGIFRVALVIATRFHHGGWLLLHGIINFLLGLMILQEWPISGLWVIGLFIGIDMMFNGWSLVMLGLAVRSIPKQPPQA